MIIIMINRLLLGLLSLILFKSFSCGDFVNIKHHTFVGLVISLFPKLHNLTSKN